MVANEELLHDITPTNNPINVHCNAGTVSVNKNGLLGDYPEWVWFNPHGFDNVCKHYCETMDSNKSNLIVLHRKDGSLIHLPLAVKVSIAMPYNKTKLSMNSGP